MTTIGAALKMPDYKNPEALAALEGRIQSARSEGVTATPTFFVNGTRVPNSSMEALSAAVDAELAK